MATTDESIHNLIERIASDVKEVKETSQQTSEDVILIKERIQNQRQDLNTHHQLLFGQNNNNGLVMDVKELINDKRTREKKKWMYLSAFLVVAGRAFWDLLITVKKFLISPST